MGNANIDSELKREIEKILEKKEFRIKYQNLKGFIDNACAREIEKITASKTKSL